jgi:hypothetical protein
MAVFVACPSCSVKLNIPENFLGKKVRCASCSTVFQAKQDVAPPDPAPAESAPAPPAPAEAPLEQHVTEDLPPAPLQEEEAAPLDDRGPGYEDYDDTYDREEKKRRRKKRRDFDPHRSGMVMGLGITSAALGVIGFSGPCCCLLCDVLPVAAIGTGIPAWIMGQSDIRKMDTGSMDPDGRGGTQAGFICGIVGSALGVMSLLCSVGTLFLNFGNMFARNAGNF